MRYTPYILNANIKNIFGDIELRVNDASFSYLPGGWFCPPCDNFRKIGNLIYEATNMTSVTVLFDAIRRRKIP